MALNYSKKVLENFKHPKNIGEMKNPDGTGRVGNLRCGDLMELYIKIGKNRSGKKIIKDIKFKTFGCVAAIATASTITQLAKRKTIEQALKITNQKVAKMLGGLPPVKMHCSNLAADALKKAIENYKSQNGKKH